MGIQAYRDFPGYLSFECRTRECRTAINLTSYGANYTPPKVL